MRALRRNENGGATEVDPAVSAASAGSIRISDAQQSTLTLIRVQSDATARRGRGLVRFITDLVQREDTPIPVVGECPKCGRFLNVRVDLSDADDPRVLPETLPDNCYRCGEPLDTPEMIATLVGSARLFYDTRTPVGAA